MIAEAGVMWPCSSDCADLFNAACSASRSRSLNSSPSSSEDELEDRALWKRSRLVKDEAPLLNTSAQLIHPSTLRADRVDG